MTFLYHVNNIIPCWGEEIPIVHVNTNLLYLGIYIIITVLCLYMYKKQCQITEVQFLFGAKKMSNCFVHEYPPNRGSEFRLQTELSFRLYNWNVWTLGEFARTVSWSKYIEWSISQSNLEFWTSSFVIFHDLDNYEV